MDNYARLEQVGRRGFGVVYRALEHAVKLFFKKLKALNQHCYPFSVDAFHVRNLNIHYELFCVARRIYM
jgi:hypothetical protein